MKVTPVISSIYDNMDQMYNQFSLTSNWYVFGERYLHNDLFHPSYKTFVPNTRTKIRP